MAKTTKTKPKPKSPKPSETDARANLKALMAEATKEEKKPTQDRTVWSFEGMDRQRIVDYARLKAVTDEVKPFLTQQERLAKDIFLRRWVDTFWSQKSVPDNPEVVLLWNGGDKRGMDDIQLLYVLSIRKDCIGKKLPSPSELEKRGVTPQEYLQNLLTADEVGLTKTVAQKFIEDEVVIVDRFELSKPLNDMLESDDADLRSFATKCFANWTGQECEPYTADERRKALVLVQEIQIKDGFLQRVLGYAKSSDGLLKLLRFLGPSPSIRSFKFGISDKPQERIERLQATIAEFLSESDGEE